MFQSCSTIRATFMAVALSGVALLSACGGLSRQPLAPEPTVAPKTPSSRALPRAAKRASAGPSRENAKRFSRDRDDDMGVSFSDYGDDAQDVRVEAATFHVQKGSIHEDRDITMNAFSGFNVSDVEVDFSPDGFVFDQPASLTILLRGPLNPDRLKVYHISSDGTVTQASFSLFPLGKNRWQITIQVPGFSTYSLGDGLGLEVTSW